MLELTRIIPRWLLTLQAVMGMVMLTINRTKKGSVETPPVEYFVQVFQSPDNYSAYENFN
jgi:hypothetical protein